MQCNIEKDNNTYILNNKIKNIEYDLEKTSKKIESYENTPETIVNNVNSPSPIITSFIVGYIKPV
jgi:hypothetical protein